MSATKTLKRGDKAFPVRGTGKDREVLVVVPCGAVDAAQWIPIKDLDPDSHRPAKYLSMEEASANLSPRNGYGRTPVAFDNHFEEFYQRRHNENLKKGSGVVEELHDKTGQMEKLWTKQGKQYKRVWDEKYETYRVGPVIESNQDAKEYSRLSREVLGGKGFVLV